MTTPNSQNNVVEITEHVRTFNARLDMLLPLVDNKRDLLEQPFIMLLTKGMTLSDTDISMIAISVKKKFKLQDDIHALELKIKTQSDPDLWRGRSFIDDKDNCIIIYTKKEQINISNFKMIPSYTITVNKGEKFHVYDVQIWGDDTTYEFMLASSDFNNLSSIQEQLQKQMMGKSLNINGCAQYMKDLFHKYVTIPTLEQSWKFEKQGTSLLGLERLEDNGPKYFCTPKAIFNDNGQVSHDIVYMPMNDEHVNQEEIKKLENLGYDAKKWAQEIAPTVLKSIIHMNEKIAMLSIAGWMGSIPHDYVVRKESKTGFFPHCHIVAEPGAGKSTIMTAFKQLMGHNDAAPRTFSSAFETQKLLNSSYTIPAVIDEYGARWDQDKTMKINAVLVESFMKAGYSKGQATLTSVYYKYKNPLLFAGQIPTSDHALATRIVPVRLYKSFHNSKRGKDAIKHLKNLQHMEDKNFWVGYCLWAGQHSNQEVKSVYEDFRSMSKDVIKDSRVADIYAVVMLGLYYLRKLGLELGLSESDMGFTIDDIHTMPHSLSNVANLTETEEMSPLTDFLEDIANFGTTYGNSSTYGMNFGKMQNVMTHKPSSEGAGEYGRTNKQQACVFGREIIAIDVKSMVDVLNRVRGKERYNYKEVMTFVQAKFEEAMQNDGKGLVLAPQQYTIQMRLVKNQSPKKGYYTAFDKETMINMIPKFSSINM